MQTLSEWFWRVFASDEFMPHGHCYLWKPGLLWLHVGSDTLIGVAYVAIALMLYLLVKKIRLPFTPMILAFGLFIFACGLTHFMSIWTAWVPNYWLSGFVKLLTAGASVATAAFLLPMRPRVVQVAAAAAVSEARRVALESKTQELEQLNAQVQQMAREELRQSEERFRSLVLAIAQIVVTRAPDGRILQASPSWCQFTGQSEQEVLGWGWLDAVHPEDREPLLEAWRGAVREVPALFEREYRLRRASGDYAHVIARATPLRNADGTVREWVGANTDITAQKNAELAVRESEARYRGTFDRAPVGIANISLDGRFLQVNPRFCQLLGYSEDELRQKTFIDVTHPEDVAADLALVEEILENKLPSYQMEKRYLRKDGTVQWVEVTVALQTSPDGTPLHFIAMVVDVSERRAAAAERERLLREAQEAVRVRDEFLMIAAHELRTPVTSLQLHLERLERTVRGEGAAMAEASAKLEVVRRQVRRIAVLNESLLDVTRLQAGQITVAVANVDAPSIVREVVERLEPDFHRASTKLLLEAPLHLTVRADPLRLEQILTNLLNNALKFGAEKPVEVLVEDGPHEARIRVRDRGIGISPEAAARLFRKFERAAPAENYGGLGLGLFISRTLVEQMGGRIEVASTPGEGATFTVVLPRP